MRDRIREILKAEFTNNGNPMAYRISLQQSTNQILSLFLEVVPKWKYMRIGQLISAKEVDAYNQCITDLREKLDGKETS